MVTVDLHNLTAEELKEADAALLRDRAWMQDHDPEHVHPELAHLFEALEAAVAEEYEFRRALQERRVIAEALGIDLESGEGPGA